MPDDQLHGSTATRSGDELAHLHVLLDIGVIETTTDQSLGVEDGVGGVHGRDVLGRVTDEPLLLGERDIGGGGSVTLVVGDDLDL